MACEWLDEPTSQKRDVEARNAFIVAKDARGQVFAPAEDDEGTCSQGRRPLGHDRAACEVNIEPPNEGSLAFHRSMGFAALGRCRGEGRQQAGSVSRRRIAMTWANFSGWAVAASRHAATTSVASLAVESFENRPEQVGNEKSARPDDGRSPEQHAAQFADFPACRRVVGVAGFSLTKAWRNQYVMTKLSAIRSRRC